MTKTARPLKPAARSLRAHSSMDALHSKDSRCTQGRASRWALVILAQMGSSPRAHTRWESRPRTSPSGPMARALSVHSPRAPV